MIGERVDADDRVLARLDDLVEIADRAAAHGAGQGPVLPDRLVAVEQEAPDEVAGGKVIVARDRHQRALQPPRHVFDEAGLAATGRPLEHDGEPARVALLEDSDLILRRKVEGFHLRAVRRRRSVDDAQTFRVAGCGHHVPVAASRGNVPLARLAGSASVVSSNRGACLKKS